MSARKLSIVSNKTFRGACGASAAEATAPVSLTATFALTRGVGLAALAESGVGSGAGSFLQAVAKVQSASSKPAQRAVSTAIEQCENEKRRLVEDGRNTGRGSVRRVLARPSSAAQ